MDLFKRKEPLIIADALPNLAYPPSAGAVPPISVIPNSGGLTQMVEHTLALEQENNRILKHMQTMNQIGFWVKLAVWALVLGLPVLFFRPLIEVTKRTIQENPTLFGVPSSSDFYKAIDEFSTKHPIP